jgi:hypothetical protein
MGKTGIGLEIDEADDPEVYGYAAWPIIHGASVFTPA